MAGVENLDSNAILASLVSFHAAAVVIADCGCAGGRLLRIHRILRSRRWGAMAEHVPISAGFRPACYFKSERKGRLKSATLETPIGYRGAEGKTSSLHLF